MNLSLVRVLSVMAVITACLLSAPVEAQAQYTIVAGPYTGRPHCVPAFDPTSNAYFCVARSVSNVVLGFRYNRAIFDPAAFDLGVTTVRNPSCARERSSDFDELLLICAVVGGDNALYGAAAAKTPDIPRRADRGEWP